MGQQIIVHTDHENLTYKNFNSDRVMQWRLQLALKFNGIAQRCVALVSKNITYRVGSHS
jgi:hypothetical protein